MRSVAEAFADRSVRATQPVPHDHFTPLGYTNILLASPVFSRSMAFEKSFIAMRSVITGCRSSLPALSNAVIWYQVWYMRRPLMPCTFEHDVHAQASSLICHNRAHVFLRRIEHVISFHLARDLAPVLVYFNGKHASRAHGPRHRNSKQSDGPAAGNGHGFRGDLTCKHGVDRVAQRIENRSIFLRNGWVQFPNI